MSEFNLLSFNHDDYTTRAALPTESGGIPHWISKIIRKTDNGFNTDACVVQVVLPNVPPKWQILTPKGVLTYFADDASLNSTQVDDTSTNPTQAVNTTNTNTDIPNTNLDISTDTTSLSDNNNDTSSAPTPFTMHLYLRKPTSTSQRPQVQRGWLAKQRRNTQANPLPSNQLLPYQRSHPSKERQRRNIPMPNHRHCNKLKLGGDIWQLEPTNRLWIGQWQPAQIQQCCPLPFLSTSSPRSLYNT